MIADGSDYSSWRSLVLEIETASPEDIDAISLAYESFLSRFPLCHWHLEKYAYHKGKRCGPQEAVNVYERGVEAAKFSVGFWVDYFTFGATCFGDPEDVRRFKQFVANLEDEMGYEKNDSSKAEQVSVPCAAMEISGDEISLVVKDLLDSSDRSLKSKALERYRSIGEGFYQEASQTDEKIKCFEAKIRRRYFYVTPLDNDQLDNWHLYLDFIEKQDNLDWTMNVYERCLIPCANYPEFWMRYVEFLESKGGCELANSALDRATQIFLKNVPEIHLFSARFKEHIGDVNGARAALLLCDTKADFSFVDNVVTLANMERRLGNFTAASATYEKALKTVRERQKLHLLPILYSQFARLTFLITGSAAAATDVLVEGVRHVPRCRFLLEELIKFAMTHEGASQVNIIDSVVAGAISPGLDEYEGFNAKDQENISCLFLEFVNLCGTVHDIRKAWNRHIKLFPQFLRMRTTRKHSRSGHRLIDVVTDQKGDDVHPIHDQPFRSMCFGHPIQLQGQEQALSAKAVEFSSKDASQYNEPAHKLSCQSREDKLGSTVVSAQLANQAIENALDGCNLDQDLSCKPSGDEVGQINAKAELAKQSKENAWSPHESAHNAGKSAQTIESVEASHSSLIYVQPVLDHELRQQNHPVSLDDISLNSQGKESQELVPMSCDEYETRGVVPASSESTPRGTSNVNSNSFAGPKSTQMVEFSEVHVESGKIGSVSRQHNTPPKAQRDPGYPSSTSEDSIEIDHKLPGPESATSGFQEHAKDQEHQLQQSFYQDNRGANAWDRKILTNLGDAQEDWARHKNNQAQLGAVHTDKATGHDQPVSSSPPPVSISAGQPPESSQAVSYPQQNMNQITSSWQTQQGLTVNQMLQYHYHQQQLLQQQYQQLHMQHPYLQLQQLYMNQQSYQLQPQQHVQLVHQQQYAQQQQLQSPPYQLQQQIPSFQQSQQQLQQQHYQQSQQMLGHQQLQQGQESHLNYQQAHEKQFHQPQDPAFQAHQLAYKQQASQGQQLLLQHYQQYQGYQHLQQQQQSQEGQQNVHQYPGQKQQDELLEQHYQQVTSKQNSTQNMNQNQKGSKTAPRNHDGAAEPSKSPHHRVQSPQVLQ
ncbi:UNVERIFIED_CONTAM: Pre-processing factor 39 [Sesamum angustifolium]|uniref:Pre-processing factor 39 n=1 Tax=Sesamum angustifolium TaxID=2727405 RepID=A0AAW2KVK2_9LAMI